MVSIKIVCVGNLKEKFWREAEQEYVKRLSKFCKLEIKEIEEQNQFKEEDRIIEVESKKIEKEIENDSYLMDINGNQYSSEEFAKLIEQISLKKSQITFVIGGSNGVSKKIKDTLKNKISFGKATYPHNLARIILLEQIYRAFMINSGAKYHK